MTFPNRPDVPATNEQSQDQKTTKTQEEQTQQQKQDIVRKQAEEQDVRQ